LATRQQLGPFLGHLDSITAVAFSPDSRLMATASRDGTVLIREVRGK
jgi:WD40 repeat protein